MKARLALGVAALASLALAALPSVARANPLDTFGFGSRGTAMGGAVSADTKDVSANYYNPAGLARAPGLEISFGYFRAEHYLKTNGQDNHVDPVKGLNAGVVAPGTILGVPFAFGLGLHLPDDRLSRVRALRQEQPRWELYDNRNQRLYFATNVAVSPWPWLELGAGLSFMSSTRGRLDISGTANIFRPEQSQLRHEVDADLTAIRYPQAGMRVNLGSRASLALVYRGEFQLDLDLKARLNGDISQLTTAYYALEAFSVNAFLPRQVVIGSSWKITKDFRANVDLTWIQWSAYISPVAHLNVALDIPPPAGGWPANITPPSTPAPTKVVPLEMQDRVVPHLGFEWRALHKAHTEGFVRGGYEFAKSPVRAQRGVTNYLDRDRHSISAGLGVRLLAPIKELPGDVRFDVHTQLSVLPDRITMKNDPSDFIGDYSAGGHIWNVGVTTSVGF
ncbi:MAG: long-chain fatty acid transport protein [Myxococcaceae bacterium]|nr:long-chain fatty acid transport protein [Myxococcaceae bacterium]